MVDTPRPSMLNPHNEQQFNDTVDSAEDGYCPYVLWKGNWENEILLTVKSDQGDLYYNPDFLDSEDRIYRMHAVGDVSPKFYHPSSLYWSPLIAMTIITILNPSYLLLWLGIFMAGNALHRD